MQEEEAILKPKTCLCLVYVKSEAHTVITNCMAEFRQWGDQQHGTC